MSTKRKPRMPKRVDVENGCILVRKYHTYPPSIYICGMLFSLKDAEKMHTFLGKAIAHLKAVK